MSSTQEQRSRSARRSLWVRLGLITLNLLAALTVLWLGMSIPSYFRSVSPLVLEAAAEGTPRLPAQAEAHLDAGRPGLAQPLLQAEKQVSRKAPDPSHDNQVERLLQANPLYRWSGGPAPFYEQFLRMAGFLRGDETSTIPTLLPAEHRRVLLGFLEQSPNRNVQRILSTRSLGGWQRFYPVYSTSGHPLEAVILATALLEQSSALPEGIQRPLLDAIAGALEGHAADLNRLESLYIGILTLGRHANWLQLASLMGQFDSPQQLLFAAQALQEDPAKFPILFAGLQNAASTGLLADYLARHGDRGWKALGVALSMGQGAVKSLLVFDKPVYQPPEIWYRLPLGMRDSQQHFKGFAESYPGAAIGLRALSFTLCGFFLVGVLRVLILGGRPRPDQVKRVLINLDSLVGGVLVMILLWVLIEPGLLEFQPNKEGSLQINLAQVIPGRDALTQETSTMIDQVTILILLLFFVLQLLVFIFGLLKITEVRRRSVGPDKKIELLENEENLFDLGLYVGLGGTVSALILVVLNVVDASLMAAYASTLFGIIFVAILKIGFLRPYRRQLILQKA